MTHGSRSARLSPAARISALVSDVDGTLVRDDKSLPGANRRAVAKLRERGVAFAVVSSRPPRGLRAVIEVLGISTVVAGFNGGVLAAPDLTVLEQHLLAPDIAQRTLAALTARGVDVWVFAGQDWLLRNPAAGCVAREVGAVGFPPVVVRDFGAALGAALRSIAARLAIPLDEIAVIGDGANDVAMFGPSSLSIAMGNAEPAVRQAADQVTGDNNAGGFAAAVDRFILASASPSPQAGASR